jgi:hypothetical protein
MKTFSIDLSDAILAVGIIIFIIIFSGDPDLMDAIIYKLTEGKLAPPTP